jgi:hypothetical protein
MSIRCKIWDIKFTRDFSRLFVKPQEEEIKQIPTDLQNHARPKTFDIS